MLVSPGLALVGQRAIAQAPERTEALAALVLTLQTLLACVVYAFVLVVAALEPRGPVVSLLLAIQGMTLFFTAWNMGWVLQAHERMVAPTLAAFAFNVLQLPGLMLLLHQPDDLTLYAAVTVAFACGSVAYNIWYLAHCRILRPSRMRPTLAGCCGVLREAWPRRPRRRASRGSSTPRRAASTGRRPMEFAPRTPSPTRRPPMPTASGWSNATCRRWRVPTSARPSCACHGVRRLAAHPLRHRAEQSGGTRLDDRPHHHDRDGMPWRPLVHVQDIAAAIAATLEAPREAVASQVLNVGDTDNNYRIREIAEAIGEAFPNCRIEFGSNAGDNRSYRVCFDKIRQVLPGFRCQWTARKGAEQRRAEVNAPPSIGRRSAGRWTHTRTALVRGLLEINANLAERPPLRSTLHPTAAGLERLRRGCVGQRFDKELSKPRTKRLGHTS